MQVSPPEPVEAGGAEQADPVVAVAVVISHLGVLVRRRVDSAPPWTFLGGKMEPGETPVQAAVREVWEEAREVVAAVGSGLSEVRWVTRDQLDELLPDLFDPVRSWLAASA